ncbi:hypothetical protein [Metabacillus fastidiosus]|uniref:hypothetical protein n=1 Tax=Metabacillus fastidiosus TaxID=1458 RepID=UPI003D2B9FCD
MLNLIFAVLSLILGMLFLFDKIETSQQLTGFLLFSLALAYVGYYLKDKEINKLKSK